MNSRNLVIPDIHGCCKTFKALIKKIDLTENDNLYLLGDYIDKGKCSSAVLDYIIELSEKYNLFPLLGNHEYDILRTQKEYDDDTFYFFVKRISKSADLLDENHKIKKKYYDFFVDLLLYYEVDNFILVHAGLDFSNADIFKNKSVILNLRTDLSKGIPAGFSKTIIHGHEPVNIDVIRENINRNSKVLPLDNGCVYTKPHKIYDYTKLGSLCCFNMGTYELILQENID